RGGGCGDPGSRSSQTRLLAKGVWRQRGYPRTALLDPRSSKWHGERAQRDHVMHLGFVSRTRHRIPVSAARADAAQPGSCGRGILRSSSDATNFANGRRANTASAQHLTTTTSPTNRDKLRLEYESGGY